MEAVPQPFKYVGQHGVMTESNGLQYMRARYYDPQVGRFISEDPLGFGGGDLNLYVYASNSPIMLIDPWGLCAKDTFWGTVKTIGSGVVNAGVQTWNALANNEELHRGVEFGVKAAGVVTGEVAKIVAQDVAMAITIPVTNYILTPAGGFAFGKSVISIGVVTNVAKFGGMAEGISDRIQNIQYNIFTRQ